MFRCSRSVLENYCSSFISIGARESYVLDGCQQRISCTVINSELRNREKELATQGQWQGKLAETQSIIAYSRGV